jgi:hypothetical protein
VHATCPVFLVRFGLISKYNLDSLVVNDDLKDVGISLNEITTLLIVDR